MGFFMPLMHECCDVAFLHFSCIYLSLLVFHYFFFNCRDAMRGSMSFAEHFYVLAALTDKSNDSPDA